jgi:putative acetyltransferase
LIMNLQDIDIRPIKPADNAAIARIIRQSLEEFGANHPGTVYYDSTTDCLSELFAGAEAHYLVAEYQGELLGGSGIYPTEGLPEGVAELVKLYLTPKSRGIGLGKKLMQTCLDWAKQQGKKSIYLETMPELKIAVPMYEAMGFEYLDGPLGNSGHFGCAIQMIRKL